jgi:hypothetical protein
MAFEGVFKAVADYLQPVLKSTALLLPIMLGLAETQRSAIVVGVVYFVLYLASSYASRRSHVMADRAGGEEAGSRFLWMVVLVSYVVLVPVLFFEHYYVAIIGFIVLYIIQNFWRPVLISRFDTFATETHGATVLSVESQAKAVSTMIVAPILGLAVDTVVSHGPGGSYWPVGALAAIISLCILVTFYRNRRSGRQQERVGLTTEQEVILLEED